MVSDGDQHIRFQCPHCTARMKATESRAGRRVKCAKCGEIVRIPTSDQEPSVANVSPRLQEVPVVCNVCATRMYAKLSQVGKSIECPDCFASNLVPPPPKPQPKKSPVAPKEDDEYRLSDDIQPNLKLEDVAVVCETCGTRMYAPAVMVGKSVRCPDCNTSNAVPVVQPKQSATRTPSLDEPSAFDVGPTTYGNDLLEEADQAIEEAAEKIRRREDAQPTPPKFPFLSAYACPIIPAVGLAILTLTVVLVIWLLLFDFVNSMQGVAAMLAPFFWVMSAVTLAAVFVATSVVWLSIVESTSLCLDKLETWPDGLLDWFGHSLFVINAIAICGVVAFPLGQLIEVLVPEYAAIETKYGPIPFGTVLFVGVTFFCFPVFLLSMLESASRAMIFSRFIWTSLVRMGAAWFLFYLNAAAMVGVFIAISLIAGDSLDRLVQTIFAAVGFVFSMIYFRLLGRLAWMIGENIEIRDPPPQEVAGEINETEDDLLGDPASSSV